MDQDVWDLTVIGGGPAGMSGAIVAAELGQRVLLLEKQERAGRKILASGNGRCNLMNRLPPRYYGDSIFAERALKRCGPQDIEDFFHRWGLLLREEAQGRVYPVTGQAASVLAALTAAMDTSGVTFCRGSAVQQVVSAHEGFEIRCGAQRIFSRRVLIACGGAAQPKLGGCGDGYALLSSLGHHLIPVSPALTPMNTDPRSISGLSGLRVLCRLSLKDANGSLLKAEEGEILFTDYGISGICVMQCARFAIPGSSLTADFLSPVFPDRTGAEHELAFRMNRFPDLPAQRLLEGILPAKLAFAVMKQAGFSLRGERVRDLPSDSPKRIATAGYGYRFSDLHPRGLDQAQVTAGGMDCAEFSPETMESRLVPGLFAAGEVLNVDGDCGGFNLMFAFASGMIAGGYRRKEQEL